MSKHASVVFQGEADPAAPPKGVQLPGYLHADGDRWGIPPPLHRLLFGKYSQRGKGGFDQCTSWCLLHVLVGVKIVKLVVYNAICQKTCTWSLNVWVPGIQN